MQFNFVSTILAVTSTCNWEAERLDESLRSKSTGVGRYFSAVAAKPWPSSQDFAREKHTPGIVDIRTGEFNGIHCSVMSYLPHRPAQGKFLEDGYDHRPIEKKYIRGSYGIKLNQQNVILPKIGGKSANCNRRSRGKVGKLTVGTGRRARSNIAGQRAKTNIPGLKCTSRYLKPAGTEKEPLNSQPTSLEERVGANNWPSDGNAAPIEGAVPLISTSVGYPSISNVELDPTSEVTVP
ncbi:hypothetical protein C8R45DRAFT_939726 [Mycena sanguinolenta]|nr:hypothetical protein C8R45DRAFT_939726 [Mycena sanguinolenta]